MRPVLELQEHGHVPLTLLGGQESGDTRWRATLEELSGKERERERRNLERLIISALIYVPGSDCWSWKLALPSTRINNCLSSVSIWNPYATCFMVLGVKRWAFKQNWQHYHNYKPKVPWPDMLEEMKTIVLMHDENKKYSHKVPTPFTATDNRQLLGHFSIRVQLVMLHIIVLFGLILWTMPCRGSIACWTAILACVIPQAMFLSANQTRPLSQENQRKWAT